MFSVLLLLEKRGLAVIQNLLVSVILLEFKLLKYCFLYMFQSFYTLIPLFVFVTLPVYSCAKFIKLITQFRPYHDFVSVVFGHERIVAKFEHFCLEGANASRVD